MFLLIPLLKLIGLILFFGITWLGLSLGFDRLALWLATGDKWWSPFRLRPPPGEIRFLLKGNVKGPIDTIIHDVPGWHVDANCIFQEDPEPEGGYLLERLGIVVVPFNRRFHSRDMKYDVLEQVGGVEKMVSKKREGPQFFFNTVMSLLVEGAEDAGGIPINVKVTFTLRMRDPIKAEFTIGKPEDQASSAVKAIVRLYVGGQKFNDLRNTKRELPPEDFTDRCGFQIVEMRLESFTLVNEGDDYAKATRQQEINKLNAEAAKEKAKEIGTLAEAEANRIRIRNKARTEVPGAELLAIADAIEISRPSTIVLGESMLAVTPSGRTAPPATP